jgi:hypothetical protein
MGGMVAYHEDLAEFGPYFWIIALMRLSQQACSPVLHNLPIKRPDPSGQGDDTDADEQHYNIDYPRLPPRCGAP